MLSYATAAQSKEIIALLNHKAIDRPTKTRQLLRLVNHTQDSAQVAILALTAAQPSN